MARPAGLGKGLAALLPDDRPVGLLELPVESIERNPHQPRKQFDGLDELAASIRDHGVLQPLLVSVLSDVPGERPRYRLITGERRLQAATLAGVYRVPAVVKEVSDQQLVELALIENIQREDLNVLEEAAAYQHLIGDFGLTHEDVANRVGKARVSVANALRLLRAAPAVREALLRDEITEGHARAILGAGDLHNQERLLEQVLAGGASVRQTEELARRYAHQALELLPTPTPVPERDPDLVRVEHLFRQALGTRVKLDRSRRGGRLTIFFGSDEELDTLYHRLGGG
ncbi:MAG: ParB/RepB/Spo0J family partition protein [Chloroflexota bacterium]